MKYETSCSYCGHNQIYSPRKDKIPKKPHTTCKACGRDFVIDISTSENIPRIPKVPKPKVLEKSIVIPPQITDTGKGETAPPTHIIDDPDELLYSVAIRELNKKQPDPRWASILIQCRKELGKRKDEMVDQLQKLPTVQLIEILEKAYGKSLLKESTN